MQKRVALARAIAPRPEVLFFDEPTTGLDPIHADVINDLIVSLVDDLGITALTITHDMASARKIAHRVAMLYRGRIIWHGAARPALRVGQPLCGSVRSGQCRGTDPLDRGSRRNAQETILASIAHLSDVHFGRHDPVIVTALEELLMRQRPELVVISGDLTQRAKIAEYELACAFIDRLEQNGLSVLAVPGNHDVPLYDVARRFARPLDRYKRFIDDDLCPWFESETLAVLGLNTARSLTIKDGSINHEQMAMLRDRFRDVPPHKTRILVTHHPLFAMPIGEEDSLTKVVNRHDDALTAVTDAGVHLLLAGHFHRNFAKVARDMVEKAGPALVIQAGTATSTRVRDGEAQNFNWIETGKDKVDLQVLLWDSDSFEADSAIGFHFDGENWRSAVPAETGLPAGPA